MPNDKWKIKYSLVWTYTRWQIYLHCIEHLTKYRQLLDDNKHELWLQQWPWKGIIDCLSSSESRRKNMVSVEEAMGKYGTEGEEKIDENNIFGKWQK